MGKIRRMEEEDVEKVLQIERSVFPNPWPALAFLSELRVPVSRSFVLEKSGELIGYIIYRVVKEEMHVLNIAIRPDWQGKGYGKRLMKWAMERERKEGVKYVTLEVRKSNIKAIRLYEKLGFQKLRVIKNYYMQPVEDAVVMIKFL
jgi:ribosomal-protein-alanine N-acetyltransferase